MRTHERASIRINFSCVTGSDVDAPGSNLYHQSIRYVRHTHTQTNVWLTMNRGANTTQMMAMYNQLYAARDRNANVCQRTNCECTSATYAHDCGDVWRR